MDIFVYTDATGLQACIDTVAPYLASLGTLEVFDCSGLFTTRTPLRRSGAETADFFLVPLNLRLADIFVWRTLFGMTEIACTQAFQAIDDALVTAQCQLAYYHRGTRARHLFFQLGDLTEVFPALSHSVVFKESAHRASAALAYPYYPYARACQSRPIGSCPITVSFRGSTQYTEVRRALARASQILVQHGYACAYEALDRLVVRPPAQCTPHGPGLVHEPLEQCLMGLRQQGYDCVFDATPGAGELSPQTSWEISLLPALPQELAETLASLRQHGYRLYYETTPEASTPSYKAAYGRLLDDSQFILCPRGIALNSIRFFEALAYGRIPILLADDTRLPLEWEIDYTPFVVRVPEPQVYEMSRCIAAFLQRTSLSAASQQAQAVFTQFLQQDSQDVFMHRCLRYLQHQLR